jgi:hypothetical protein
MVARQQGGEPVGRWGGGGGVGVVVRGVVRGIPFYIPLVVRRAMVGFELCMWGAGAWAGWRGRSGVFSSVCNEALCAVGAVAWAQCFGRFLTRGQLRVPELHWFFSSSKKFAGAGHRGCPSGHEDAVLDCPHS